MFRKTLIYTGRYQVKENKYISNDLVIQLPRVFPAGGTDFSFGLLYDDHCVFSDDGLKKKLLEVQTVWYLNACSD